MSNDKKMQWRENYKRGEVFISKEGYKIEKEPKETCYSAFSPDGKFLGEIHYYPESAKAACEEHARATQLQRRLLTAELQRHHCSQSQQERGPSIEH